ncbi:mannose-1-phosphate guanyltransferase [Natronococcus pandeyae]|uniref:Mannose-1-phosphate guanyltransferase n=1 Tax=Natronococcus pandeyae TaxID=2055836 RepID=A0A8J8Q127_9EURY|nr:sugar phosphate nucleotidyltransferase [Natronococcus pandeyae]TYL36859.1 mannose-1-phosphate guanyltransferase [Natronococcus pandeyae]
MDRPIVACVLAGGSGNRLYPASRPGRPKQFLTLGGDRSLLSRTLERVQFTDERYVLTTEEYVDTVHEHAPSAGVLVEPESMDTGPALVYAAWRLRDRFDAEPVLLAVPSDHRVEDEAAFAATCERAAELALETGGLVTLGVEPTRPEVGYGYVVPAAAENDVGDVASVDRFTEKPDREDARRLVEVGAYWNAGIFAWTPTVLLRAARDSPLEALVSALEDGEPERGFEAVDAISVDDAIMETTDDAYVTPLSVGWDDLGTWDAIGRALDGDEDDTVVLEGDVLSIDSEGNVVTAPDRHVSLVGIEDVIVAAVDDRLLVADRDRADRVRDVVARRRTEETR